MPWYAIQSVYLSGRKSDGANIFEERVVTFQAESFDEALEKGAAESKRYISNNAIEAYPLRQCYEQDGRPLVDAYEVWSKLFESRLSLADFYAARYSQYEYHPE